MIESPHRKSIYILVSRHGDHIHDNNYLKDDISHHGVQKE